MEKKPGDRKKRIANFSIAEKTYLVELVEGHFSIIENKRTDAASMVQKNTEWEEIAKEFNSQNMNVTRTWASLKMAWENIKKYVKKLAIQERSKRIGRGGGPVVYSTIRPEEVQLYEKVRNLINPMIVGPIDPFDNDSGRGMQEDIPFNKSMNASGEILVNAVDNGDLSSYSSLNLRTSKTDVLRQIRFFPIKTDSDGHEEINFSSPQPSDRVEESWLPGYSVVKTEPEIIQIEEESSLPGPSVSETVEQEHQPPCDTRHEKFKKSYKSQGTRHKSARRRRSVATKSRNVELVELQIQSLISANKHADEQHEIMMKIFAEKLKQEKYKSKMMEKQFRDTCEMSSDENT